jgi:transposase-like protein
MVKLIKVIEEIVWLWIVTEPTEKTILGIPIYHTRTMLIAESFIRSLLRKKIWKTSNLNRWWYMVSIS